MANSILKNRKLCYLCGSQMNLESHHVYGAANRNISEREGFKVWLCHTCHNEPPYGIHFNRQRELLLKQRCQAEYEKTHTREEFMKLIGRSYL